MLGDPGRGSRINRSPDKRNRTHNGPGRTHNGPGRAFTRFDCECGREFIVAADLLAHINICPIHQKVTSPPNISYDDIKASVDKMQQFFRTCREQTVCIICDKFKRSADANGEQVNSIVL